MYHVAKLYTRPSIFKNERENKDAENNSKRKTIRAGDLDTDGLNDLLRRKLAQEKRENQILKTKLTKKQNVPPSLPQDRFKSEWPLSTKPRKLPGTTDMQEEEKQQEALKRIKDQITLKEEQKQKPKIPTPRENKNKPEEQKKKPEEQKHKKPYITKILEEAKKEREKQPPKPKETIVKNKKPSLIIQKTFALSIEPQRQSVHQNEIGIGGQINITKQQIASNQVQKRDPSSMPMIKRQPEEVKRSDHDLNKVKPLPEPKNKTKVVRLTNNGSVMSKERLYEVIDLKTNKVKCLILNGQSFYPLAEHPKTKSKQIINNTILELDQKSVWKQSEESQMYYRGNDDSKKALQSPSKKRKYTEISNDLPSILEKASEAGYLPEDIEDPEKRHERKFRKYIEEKCGIIQPESHIQKRRKPNEA